MGGKYPSGPLQFGVRVAVRVGGEGDGHTSLQISIT